MSHITETREAVLKLGTSNVDNLGEETLVFNAFDLRDALINFYGQAYARGLSDLRQAMERSNETV